MIQRIQTVYLFLAVVCCIACLILPIGQLLSDGMLPPQQMYNAWIVNQTYAAEHINNGLLLLLFILLVLTAAISLLSIFGYRNRKRQAKMCSIGMVMLVLWHVALCVLVFTQVPESLHFSPKPGASLPVVALVFLLLARKGILKDEKLVRAADRIRD